MKSKVGILGGAFNPPHNAHIKLAKTALEQLQLDQIILIPTGKAPHKEMEYPVKGETRLLMTQIAAYVPSPILALKKINQHFHTDESINSRFLGLYEKEYETEHDDRMNVSAIEIESAMVCGKPNYSIDTIMAIRSMQPDWDLFLIIGEDQADTFDRWRDYRELMKLCRVAVAGRDGIRKEETCEKFPEFIDLDFEPVDLSSTDLRKQLSRGEKPQGAMPEPLAFLINQLKIYEKL